MKKFALVRHSDNGICTLGTLLGYHDYLPVFSCRTLEPPWLNNARNKSCIPPGRYKVVPRTTDKFGDHLLVENVQGRSFILFHAGNFPSDTEGCILVGNDFGDLNNDKKLDLIGSRYALRRLLEVAGEGFQLDVIAV